jgi:hypothetical protein
MRKAFFRPSDLLHKSEDLCLKTQIQSEKSPSLRMEGFQNKS